MFNSFSHLLAFSVRHLLSIFTHTYVKSWHLCGCSVIHLWRTDSLTGLMFKGQVKGHPSCAVTPFFSALRVFITFYMWNKKAAGILARWINGIKATRCASSTSAFSFRLWVNTVGVGLFWTDPFALVSRKLKYIATVKVHCHRCCGIQVKETPRGLCWRGNTVSLFNTGLMQFALWPFCSSVSRFFWPPKTSLQGKHLAYVCVLVNRW